MNPGIILESFFFVFIFTVVLVLRKLKTKMNHKYSLLLYGMAFTSLTHFILLTISEYAPENVLFLNGTGILYLILLNVLPVLNFDYVLSGESGKGLAMYRKMLLWCYIPVGIVLIVIASSPVSHLIFAVDGSTGFSLKIGALFMFAIYYMFVSASIIFSIFNRFRIDLKQEIIAIVYLVYGVIIC